MVNGNDWCDPGTLRATAYLMKIPAFLLVLLLLAAPVGSWGAASPGDDPADAEAVDLHAMTVSFLRVSRERKPPLAWCRELAHGGLDVFVATPKTLRAKPFNALLPFVQGLDPFYAVNVYAKGDAEHRPIYLYLLTKTGQRGKIAAAFHVVDGKAQRING